MLDYWIQNGEAYLLQLKNKLSLSDTYDVLNHLDRVFEPIFKKDGTHTLFSRKFFSALNAKNRDNLIGIVKKSFDKYRESKGKICIVCKKESAGTGKGWFYPFIITKDKFPNIYPNAKMDTLTFCKECALKSVLAYHNIFFSAQNDYLTFVIFFSDTPESLSRILRLMETKITPDYYSNIKTPDKLYFPYEYLAVLLNILSHEILRKERRKLSLGAVVFGIPVVGGSKKKIFDYAEVVTRLHEMIKVFNIFRDSLRNKFGSSSEDPFITLFRQLKRGNGRDKGDFVDRNLFFRHIIRYGEINWKLAENILFFNLQDERRGRPPSYFTDFILSVLEVFNMSEKELFEKVSNMGYSLGKEFLKVPGNDPKKGKQIAFELRRKRKLEEFLDELNLLQLQIESTFDDRPFRENEKLFPKLKVFFLIGFANALFSKSKGG